MWSRRVDGNRCFVPMPLRTLLAMLMRLFVASFGRCCGGRRGSVVDDAVVRAKIVWLSALM